MRRVAIVTRQRRKGCRLSLGRLEFIGHQLNRWQVEGAIEIAADNSRGEIIALMYRTRMRIPSQIGTHSAGKMTLVPIQIGTYSEANRHPCLG